MADIELIKKILSREGLIKKNETVTPELAEVLRDGDRNTVIRLFENAPDEGMKYTTFGLRQTCPECGHEFELHNISKTRILEILFDKRHHTDEGYFYDGPKRCPSCEAATDELQNRIHAEQEKEKKRKLEESLGRAERELMQIMAQYSGIHDKGERIWPVAYEIMVNDFEKAYRYYYNLSVNGRIGDFRPSQESEVKCRFQSYGIYFKDDCVGYATAGEHFDGDIPRICPVSGETQQDRLKRISLNEYVLPVSLKVDDFAYISDEVLKTYSRTEILSLLKKRNNGSCDSNQTEREEKTPLYRYDEILEFGKHKGETALDIFFEDRQYCSWAHRTFGFNIVLPDDSLAFTN